MQIFIQSGRRVGTLLKEFVESRMRFRLRRLAWLVPTAKVRLSQVALLDGGAGKRCELRLEVVGANDVVATAQAGDWRQSIEDALALGARLLERQHRRVYAA